MNDTVEWGGREFITDPLFEEGRPMTYVDGVEQLTPWNDYPLQWNRLHRLQRWLQEAYKPVNLQKGFNADLLDGHHWAEIANLLVDFQPLCPYLTDLCALPDDGLVVKSGDTALARTLVSDHLALVIDDGDGLAGNPTFDLDESLISHSLLDGLDADDHAQYMLAESAGSVDDNELVMFDGTSGRDVLGAGFTRTDLQDFANAIVELGDYAHANFADNIVHTGDFTIQGKLTVDEVDPYVVAMEPIGDANPYAGEALETTSIWARLSDGRLMWGDEEVAYGSETGGGGAPADAQYLVGASDGDLDNEIVVTAAGLALLDDTDADAMRTTLGAQAALVSGTNIKTVNGSTLLGSGDLVVSGSVPAGTMILLSNDETDSAEHNTSTAESAALKTYNLPANSYTQIKIEALVRCRNDQDASNDPVFTWRIKVAGATERTFTMTSIGLSTNGADGGSTFVSCLSFMRAGGQVGSTAITITVQQTDSNEAIGGLVHAFRVYGIV